MHTYLEDELVNGGGVVTLGPTDYVDAPSPSTLAPEPSTVVLTASSLLALAAATRRRRA
jgi:hypothetical protein